MAGVVVLEAATRVAAVITKVSVTAGALRSTVLVSLEPGFAQVICVQSQTAAVMTTVNAVSTTGWFG